MTVLEWDVLGDRRYETGVDRGVLYLPDGTAVPWNGLVSVSESSDREIQATYYDGMKIHDLVTVGSFSGTLRAITYPDELTLLEGFVELNAGVYAGDQRPQTFGLCYRTQIGAAGESDPVGYKLHLLYNVTAIPTDKSYETISDEAGPSEFEWNITAVPEEVAGIRPTAHFVINSLRVNPVLLAELEAILYGTSETEAELIPLTVLIGYLRNWDLIEIVVNGDGTWTAIDRGNYISMLDADTFLIEHANAEYLDEEETTYVISDGTDNVPS